MEIKIDEKEFRGRIRSIVRESIKELMEVQSEEDTEYASGEDDLDDDDDDLESDEKEEDSEEEDSDIEDVEDFDSDEPVKKGTRNAKGGAEFSVKDIHAVHGEPGSAENTTTARLTRAVEDLDSRLPADSDFGKLRKTSGMSEEDFDEFMTSAIEKYVDFLRKQGGLTNDEANELLVAAKKNPDILLDPNPYMDDTKGQAHVHDLAGKGKVTKSEAEELLKNIAKLPAGEAYDWNALRRAGRYTEDQIKGLKAILKQGTTKTLSGKPIAPAYPTQKTPFFQANDEYQDEEWLNFRRFLKKEFDARARETSK